MECNKDEATRAMEIAVKKFSAKDYKGARRFVLKAQALYPGLDGTPQMLATLDVHISAENKINGESDWYGILDVNPQADDESVRKQYRKLALMLHPDKNKSVGADGAFKLVSEAWTLLSDKSKRAAYDQKINAKVLFHKAATSKAQSFTKNPPSGSKPPKSTTKANQSTPFAQFHKKPPSSHKAKQNTTFWTVCRRCKMQYEYLRVYLNHNLLCPNCHQAFIAAEISPPSAKLTKPWYIGSPGQTSEHQKASSKIDRAKPHWSPFSGAQPSASRAAAVVHEAYEQVRREREETQAAASKRENSLLFGKKQAKRAGSFASSSNPLKKRKTGDDVPTVSNIPNQMGLGPGKGGPTNVSGSNGVAKPNTTREENSQQHMFSLARKRISDWLLLSALDSQAKTVAKEENVQEKGEKADETHEKIKSSSSRSAVLKEDTLQTMTISVPDPDFHDFDRDRIEPCFGENQVWAAYDDDDGMPRYYAMIHNVISLKPFKMRISWLNSKTNAEFGPVNWVSSGFTKTCGDFRVGKHEIYSSLNSFSHKVSRWEKGTRGLIQICPKKGDVWAVYRNWSAEWNELTADEVIHKYDMVEVLEDYNEELGVGVVPLIKVAGFKTIFHRHLDTEQVRTIPREEMFRFSHQVPSYLLTGQEGSNAPKGCRELDPAATPLELLQVIAAVEKENSDEEKKVEESNNKETTEGYEEAE